MWTGAHLQAHALLRVEYFGTKPIVFTSLNHYPFWEEHPFTVKVGISEDIKSPRGLFYPNPVSSGDYLYTDNESLYKGKVSVYSVEGVLVQESFLNSNAFRLQDNLAPGTYFIVVKSTDNKTLREIIVID